VHFTQSLLYNEGSAGALPPPESQNNRRKSSMKPHILSMVLTLALVLAALPAAAQLGGGAIGSQVQDAARDAAMDAAKDAAKEALAKDGDWKILFNGKDLDGWEQHGGEATYKVEDGAIVGTSAPNTSNSFLCTQETFGDFILEFEFMGHPRLNSGVQFRSQVRRDGRVFGYQNELEDEAQDRNWDCGIYDEARRGWLYPTKDNEEFGKTFGDEGKRLWKDGEWNHIRIHCEDDHIRTYLNGELRADLRDEMDSEGLVGLQVHGVGDRTEPMSVRWRNVRIKELD
jgi:hypothetical protein